MNVEGQSAIVTGGASGLGLATAKHLASLGAQVTVLDYNDEQAAEVASQINGYSWACDVANEESVVAGVAHAAKSTGQAARILVNCAGIALAGRIVNREGKGSTDLFKKVLEVNLFGTYYTMTYCSQAMVKLPPLDTGERGVIINTASVAHEDGQIGQTAYASSKGAVASMCLPAARELAKACVRVMTIAPGLFSTPMMEALPEDTVKNIINTIPFPHRLGLAEEYAQLVQHIVTNPYLNGSTIRLDGAVRLPPK